MTRATKILVSRHEGRFVAAVLDARRFGTRWLFVESADPSGVTPADLRVAAWVLDGDDAPPIGEVLFREPWHLIAQLRIEFALELDDVIDESAFARWLDGRDDERAGSEAA